jgi:hypothetical protein
MDFATNQKIVKQKNTVFKKINYEDNYHAPWFVRVAR